MAEINPLALPEIPSIPTFNGNELRLHTPLPTATVDEIEAAVKQAGERSGKTLELNEEAADLGSQIEEHVQEGGGFHSKAYIRLLQIAEQLIEYVEHMQKNIGTLEDAQRQLYVLTDESDGKSGLSERGMESVEKFQDAVDSVNELQEALCQSVVSIDTFLDQ